MTRKLLVGLVLGSWVVTLFVVLTRAADTYEAYESAPRCPEKQAAPSCRQRLLAVVADKTTKSANRSRTYQLTLRAADADVLDVAVYDGTYDAVAINDTVEIERWSKRVTKLYRRGAEVELPHRIRPSSKLAVIIAFGVMIALSLAPIVKSLRGRRQT